MHPELLNNAGVALILFVQGLAMAVERMKAGASNWRLHLIVQSFTFLLFPIVGLAFHKMTRVVWPSEPSALRDGFLYLCVLPSTVSKSVVLTTVARGNTPGAIFNAALSNILGVVLTPLLVRLLMQASGHCQFLRAAAIENQFAHARAIRGWNGDQTFSSEMGRCKPPMAEQPQQRGYFVYRLYGLL